MSITAVPASPATGSTQRLADVSAVAGGRESHDHGRRAERGDDNERVPRGRHALLGALEQALSALMTAAPVAAPAAAAAAVAASDAAVASPVVATAPTASLVNSGDLKNALHSFAHELFDALRPSGDDGGGPGNRGRGHAWGRTGLFDIAGRLEALAQSLATGVAAPAPAPGAPPLVPATPPSTDPVPTPTALALGPTAAPAAVPDPVETTAPSAESPLLAAFKQLAAALNLGTSSASPAAVSPADSLANLLHRIAATLGADTHATATSPAGSLLDVRA